VATMSQALYSQGKGPDYPSNKTGWGPGVAWTLWRNKSLVLPRNNIGFVTYLCCRVATISNYGHYSLASTSLPACQGNIPPQGSRGSMLLRSVIKTNEIQQCHNA
jgi:hypothetical protein